MIRRLRLWWRLRHLTPAQRALVEQFRSTPYYTDCAFRELVQEEQRAIFRRIEAGLKREAIIREALQAEGQRIDRQIGGHR